MCKVKNQTTRLTYIYRDDFEMQLLWTPLKSMLISLMSILSRVSFMNISELVRMRDSSEVI